MTSPEDLVVSIRAAVAAAPNDVPLRLHLVELLADSGAVEDAIHHAAAALLTHPGDDTARHAMLALLQGVDGGQRTGDRAAPAGARVPVAGVDARRPLRLASGRPPGLSRPAVTAPRPAPQPAPSPRVEAEAPAAHDDAEPPAPQPPERSEGTWSIEGVDVTLDDVSGTQDALARVEEALLGPLRVREQSGITGHELVHGALAYGPPGCGKGLIARAVARQFQAEFRDVEMGQVQRGELDLAEVFAQCRGGPLTMLHLDRLDALGHRDADVEPLLSELDRGQRRGDGLLVVATTSRPWRVDARLLTPGRLSRAILVMPPGLVARRRILERQVRAVGAPQLSVTEVALLANGYSGRDLLELVRAGVALHTQEVARSGVVRPLTADDLLGAMRQVPPSTHRWFERAHELLDVDTDSIFTGLGAYLRAREDLAVSTPPIGG